jgi:23S rRNA (pseudouridine1915-N3)-methyltransferase
MRLLILAVGKLKTAPEQQLARDYLQRAAKLGRKLGIASIELSEVPESTAATASLRQSDEARRLLAHLPSKAFLVSLDRTGREFSSEGFATELQLMLDRGTAHVIFLVGGPDGHGDAIAGRAELKLSLGKMTWPHRLVRPMLAEQIYRSVTILINHPYHRA